MSISLILVIIIGIISYLILPFLIWVFLKDSRFKNCLVVVLFIVYLIVLLIGVLGDIEISNTVRVSVKFAGEWCSKVVNWSVLPSGVVDFVINILMLIPVGLVITFFYKSKIVKSVLVVLLIGALWGFAIETLQFILPVSRSVELSDVILNTLSVLIGGVVGVLYNILHKKIVK